MIADFEDREEGGFFFTAERHESLLARPKDPLDNALPSGNSVAILDLLALHKATGESSYREHARKALEAFATPLARLPYAMPMMLVGLDRYLDRAGPAAQPAAEPGVAQSGDERPRIVTASARPAGDGQKPLAAGQELEAEVSIAIERGWHLNANPAGSPELKATTLGLDSSSAASATLVNVAYPAGEAKALASTGPQKVPVYEGTVRITARIRLAKEAKPGPLRLTFRLSYQACNDKLCLAPARVEIPLDLTVGQ